MEEATKPHVHQIGDRTILIADVPALDVDGIGTVVVGTVLWSVAALVLGLLGERAWLHVCLVGVALGLLGLAYCELRRRRRSRLAVGGPARTVRDPRG